MGTGSPYRTPGPVHTFGAARDTDRRNHREPRPREPPRRRRRRCPLRRRSDRPAAGPCRARRRARRPRPAARRHELHPLPRARRGRPAVPLGAARRGARDGRPRRSAPVASTSTDPRHRRRVRLPVKDKAGVDHMLAPRRHVLDRVLADAAVRAGATLWTGPPSTASCVTTAAGSVGSPPPRRTGPGCGSRHASWSAPTACGRGSRHSSGPRSSRATRRAVPASTPTSGTVDWDGFEFHLGDHAFGGVFPTHFGEACVWLIRPEHLARPVLSAGARPPRGLDRGAASRPCRGSPNGSGRAACPRRCVGRSACPTTYAGRPVRAGRWSATPATTATRSRDTA